MGGAIFDAARFTTGMTKARRGRKISPDTTRCLSSALIAEIRATMKVVKVFGSQFCVKWYPGLF